MVAFIASVIVTGALIAVAILVGKRRAPGTPLTWGEAFVAGIWVFTIFFFSYGILPDQFLRWADGPLEWRSDKIGIPTGPFHVHNFKFGFIEWDGHLLWPKGIPLPNGHFILTAQFLRD